MDVFALLLTLLRPVLSLKLLVPRDCLSHLQQSLDSIILSNSTYERDLLILRVFVDGVLLPLKSTGTQIVKVLDQALKVDPFSRVFPGLLRLISCLDPSSHLVHGLARMSQTITEPGLRQVVPLLLVRWFDD